MIVAPGPLTGAEPVLGAPGWSVGVVLWLVVLVLFLARPHALFTAYNRACSWRPVYLLVYGLSWCWAWVTVAAVRAVMATAERVPERPVAASAAAKREDDAARGTQAAGDRAAA